MFSHRALAYTHDDCRFPYSCLEQRGLSAPHENMSASSSVVTSTIGTDSARLLANRVDNGGHADCRCRSGPVRSDDHTGQVAVSEVVGGDDLALCGVCGGRDDQVMGAAGSPLAAYRNEQFGMGSCDGGVIVDNRDRFFDLVDELLAVGLVSIIGKQDPDQQLGDGDRGDGYFVFVVDQLIERRLGAVGVDQERGVE